MLSDEEIEVELTELENSIFRKMEGLRQLTKQDDKWIIEEINAKKYPSNG